MTAPRSSAAPAPTVVDLRRRPDSRLQLSRVAADLFWERGVGGTRGEDVAEAAGISARTLWRYFRTKESCVEPVLEALGSSFPDFLGAWPLEESLRDFVDRTAPPEVRYSADQERALRMVHLGRTTPALRSAWLVVCDDVERRCVPLVAQRLGLLEGDPDAVELTAAVGGANRALNDALSEQYVRTGTTPDAGLVRSALVRAVTRSSGGRLGPAVAAGAADERRAP